MEVRLLFHDEILEAELVIEAAGRRQEVACFLPDAIVLAVRRGLPVMVPADALCGPEQVPQAREAARQAHAPSRPVRVVPVPRRPGT